MVTNIEHSSMIELEIQIRLGQQPDNPALLQDYLSISQAVHNNYTLQLRIFNTLLDTICDVTIAYHWRCQCLDSIHQPLLALQRLAITTQEQVNGQHLCHELATLSHYFMLPPNEEAGQPINWNCYG